MTSAAVWVIVRLQRCVATVSRWWHQRRPAPRRITWVVGTVEVAAMLNNLAHAIPDSFSVVLIKSRYYDFTYDLEIAERHGAWLRAAWEFGRLAALARGFVYLGADGFLFATDEREWEFAFLKRHGRKVVCVFAGSDIRSPALMREFQAQTGHETIVTYLDQVSSALVSAGYDDRRRRIAHVADRHADAVFNAAVDQMSYLTRPTEPFPYFFPDNAILDDDSKHAKAGPRIVVHAPSSPIIKGTQVVRAAVQRLQSEGYDFVYRELIGVPNSEVLNHLREAHIALNEFYAFVPGVFGVEAMASGCALLTRADETIEKDLPVGSNDAWVVTKAGDIYANLKALLDYPEEIGRQAAAGRAWVRSNATMTSTGERLRSVLDRL